MAELGVSVDGRAPVADIPLQARLAEEAGVATLWMACHLFLREPIAQATLALDATRRLKVALMAMSPYSVHPVYIAMAAATLDEMFPGRVILCLGAGAPADLRAAGLEAQKPLAAIGETMAICRALFAGEMVKHQGELFRVEGRRLINGGRDIPIVLAASRRQMLRKAGRDSDGVLISSSTAPAFVKACLAEADAGRNLFKAAIVHTRLGDPGDLRRRMGAILRGPHHAENVRLGGSGLDQKALWDACAAENWSEVDRLMNDDVLGRHAACGTAEDVRAKFAEYEAIGLDEIVIGGAEDSKGMTAVLNALRGQGR